MNAEWKVIAIGNPLKGDDAIALRLADELPEFEMVKAETVPENFVSLGDKGILVDSVYFQGAPGEVRLFDKEAVEEFLSTSHNLTPLILKIAAEVRLIGIQPFYTGFSERLSPQMEAKLPEIKEKVARILKEILSKE